MTTAWDYTGRRAALERRMQEQAVDLMFLPVSADLEYLTGLQCRGAGVRHRRIRAPLGRRRPACPRPRTGLCSPLDEF